MLLLHSLCNYIIINFYNYHNRNAFPGPVGSHLGLYATGPATEFRAPHIDPQRTDTVEPVHVAVGPGNQTYKRPYQVHVSLCKRGAGLRRDQSPRPLRWRPHRQKTHRQQEVFFICKNTRFDFAFSIIVILKISHHEMKRKKMKISSGTPLKN